MAHSAVHTLVPLPPCVRCAVWHDEHAPHRAHVRLAVVAARRHPHDAVAVVPVGVTRALLARHRTGHGRVLRGASELVGVLCCVFQGKSTSQGISCSLGVHHSDIERMRCLLCAWQVLPIVHIAHYESPSLSMPYAMALTRIREKRFKI